MKKSNSNKMVTDVEKFHFRLVLLGSHGTGKTSILNRFLFKKFETKYKPTVEDLFIKGFDLGSIELKVDFLDTSGTMQFPAMRRLSITTGNAFLIVYAVDDESSFEVLKMCLAEIQEIRPDFQEIPIVFAGNKCEIPKDKRTLSKESVSYYVHYELPRLRAKVIECSCKDNINIDAIFRAYLSLAKVSLCSAVSAGLKNRPSTHILKLPNEQASASSVTPAKLPPLTKESLGVRKSCDASIQLQRRETFAKSDKVIQSSSSFLTKQQPPSSAEQSKPRSRSLIWRPSRKSTRTDANTEASDCHVT